MVKNWACAIGFVLGLNPAIAQENEPPPWLVNCGNMVNWNMLICEMTQSIVLAENNQRLASIAFVKSAGNDKTEAVLTLPFGLMLSDGLTAKVNETEVAKLEFLTCEAQGCFARSPVSDDWIKSMRQGDNFTINAHNRNGDPITFSFDLTGFGQVSDLLP